MSNSKNKKVLSCSFCEKSQDEVGKLVSGVSACVCEECIFLCRDMIGEADSKKGKISTNSNIPKPAEIKAILDKYVIGQDRAKKVLSVAVHNHYKRIFSKIDTSDVELQKSNVLLIGPTGSGKTLMAQILAKILNVPFAIADATVLTEAGYVGQDVEGIISNLLNAAGGDIDSTQHGIVYIDEIEKISRKGDGPSVTRDVSGEGVQQALLKLMEGTVCNVSPTAERKHPNQEYLKVDTSKILFICGGAFDGLERIIENRTGKKSIGFSDKIGKKKDANSSFVHLQPQDLIKYGLIPEFVGRLPVVAYLEELSHEMLISILIEPRNSLIRQYRQLLRFDGVDLRFTREALDTIAEKTLERKIGARGLRSIIEKTILDIMYNVPSNKNVSKVIVNKNSVLGLEKPVLIFK